METAAEWHEIWNRLFDFTAYLVEHPDAFDDPNWYRMSGGPALYDAHEATTERLLRCEPTTAAGATAVLGCAMEIIAARERTYKDTGPRGTAARQVFCVFVTPNPERRSFEVAYRALARLSKEGRS